jgi:hypothetical protein
MMRAVVDGGSPGPLAHFNYLRPYANNPSPSIDGCGRRPTNKGGALMKTIRSRSSMRACAGSVLAALGATFGLIGISAAQQQPPVCTPQQALQVPGVLCLDTPAPPDTVPRFQPDWDVFAWNTFIALNWPALEVVPNNVRGVPDLSKSFATAANSDLAVWETFKEKREIFNQIDNPAGPGGLVWNSPVNYGPLRAGAVGPASAVQGRRVIHQNSGATQPPDGLDETVEVQSQSLEQTYPNGTANPLLSAIPPVATPRVWRGQPGAKNPIVYEVKLNYDYFNYVVGNTLNCDQSQKKTCTVGAAAAIARIHLPIRTSSSTNPLQSPPPPQLPGVNPSVVNYRAAQAVATFQTINTIYRNGGPLPAPLPPLQGSIQVKAAWLKLGGPDAKPSDYPTWHTAFAQNYISGPTGPIPSVPTLFGLVGMHIIQRVHATDPNNPNAKPTGGTFIFATWEHESIFNSPVAGGPTANAPYSYSNFYAPPSTPQPPALAAGFYPPLDQTAYPVVRSYPVLQNTIAVTTAVHNAIRARNPNSVWLNYHLVGTQFQAVDLKHPPVLPPTKYPTSANDPTGIGQPAFLANLAIETNLGLQFFQGQPPAITVIGNYQGPLISNTTNTFMRNNANTAFNGNGYNMGGCMGCHGVAQSKGYGFSFVLLDGYLGAVTDTQEHFDQPGANP